PCCEAAASYDFWDPPPVSMMTWVAPAVRCCDAACAMSAGDANPPWGHANVYLLIWPAVTPAWASASSSCLFTSGAHSSSNRPSFLNPLAGSNQPTSLSPNAVSRMSVPRSDDGVARYGANLLPSDVRIKLLVTSGIFCWGMQSYEIGRAHV